MTARACLACWVLVAVSGFTAAGDPAGVGLAKVLADSPAQVSVPSFAQTIEPILTRSGCNQGACHGKGAGQNGFRLSLRGYAPDWDHQAITRDTHGRRIDTVDPTQSLLLTKATGQIPHGGGGIWTATGRDYQTVLAWLTGGAPAPDPREPALTDLTVSAPTHPMTVGESRPLTVWATFADGQRRDVTWLAKFDSNDPALITLGDDGLARAVGQGGATALRAAYLDRVAALSLVVPRAGPRQAVDFGNHPVDRAVAGRLTELGIPPSPLADDTEFVRRVYLDTLGLPPTPDEIRAFVADARPAKRQALIDALLARPEFTDYWTLRLADLLQNRRERDHDVRGPKGVAAFRDWLANQLAANRPWNEIAAAVLTAAGDTSTNPAVGYYVVSVGEHRNAAASEAPANLAQAFLGVRIGCAQCHNHPLECYTQDDYYHFAGYLSRLRLQRHNPRKAPTRLEPLGQIEKALAERSAAIATAGGTAKAKPPKPLPPVGVTQPRTGAYLAPRPLDRSAADIPEDADPRQALAQWVTSPANPYFSGAMVNRVVAHFLGVGLVEPVDDLRATNPPSNPALWGVLQTAFVDSGFDLRALCRLILTSRTYQTTSATNPANAADQRYYSHYYARRLPAEVLADTLAAATGVPDVFPGEPVGLRAVELADPQAPSAFLSVFGRSDRTTACACQRSGDVTLAQLLHLQNSPALAAKLAHREGRLARLLASGQPDTAVIEEVFLATLGRWPQPAEAAAVATMLTAGAPRDEVFTDLFWALLNTKAFAFNH